MSKYFIMKASYSTMSDLVEQGALLNRDENGIWGARDTNGELLAIGNAICNDTMDMWYDIYKLTQGQK